MTRRTRLRSLAKINLDLRVLNKREDGFHELRTVFQTISLADTLEIEYEAAKRTELIMGGNVDIPDNLVIRAARAVLEAIRVKARISFKLTKRIPMGGGLGGGSSNAAAVLLALPVLAGRAVDFEKLAELGAGLGSDVPFFLTGGTAVAIGRGTELYGLPEIAPEPILVISSGVHVATGPAYQALGRSLTLTGSSSNINGFQSFVRALGEECSAAAASALSENDFEAVVFPNYPQLKRIQGRLRKMAAGARMTGSGSAIFAVFRSIGERERVRKVLEGDREFQGCRVFPGRLVNRAGYQRLWSRQLRDHVAPNDQQWPPRSRYER